MDDEGPLCCCEYYNINKQRTHLLTFCCECDEFDKAVDDWFKGNPQTLKKLSSIVDSFTDRCRLPWIGGAQQFDTGLVFPPLILIVSSYIACIHFLLTIIMFLALPLIVLCFYVFTIRVKIKTRFFLSLSLTSTIGLFLVYFYYVAPFKSFYINMALFSTGIIMAICFYSLLKPPNIHYTGLPTTNYQDTCSHYTFLKFCEVCGQSSLLRGKHCRICNVCVLRYDHHCVWTNCCIAEHNHRIFLCTILLYLVNIVGGSYESLLFVCDWNVGVFPSCSHEVYSTESSSLIFVCCCYAIVCGVALLILLTQQLILITFNITSYELRHMSDQQSCWDTIMSSPYNKGILNNWREFLKI